ncbi:hypothetical protein K1T71_004618 [Dendrolimus kikuchii]|uniref:Uncharacterized protein n=1 Tax=Dendrolimus kikuchii TaxID=765133 RepID=A0ACC1D8Z3_9NEOP|nr:hypothetical protein K1T71_004618 [Dendrolimus kikuchii]
MATHVWCSLALLFTLATFTLAKYAELEPWRGAGRPATAAEEAQDEKRDAEILAAVKASMQEWMLKRSRTRTKRSQGSVCYGDFGCFEDSGPFAYLETLPSPPQEVGTHFLLYSTVSRGDQPLLAVSASNMSAAWGWAARAFDPDRPTRVIVHGFGSNCDNVWVYEMRSALMAVEECNVVCVDWEGGASMPNYLRAAANTRLVGKQLAMLLQGFAKHIDLRFEDVHLIGFSLGAHVAGFAGSELRNISRITGLDPAGPLFEFQDPRTRLDRSDAKFVDVIHSNGETLILGGLGAAQPLGHVDFYPNGGRVQHGCSNLFVGAVSDLLPWAAASPEGRSLCNHRRAYKFFTDSVSPKCHFPAFPCSDYDTFLEGRCFPCDGTRRCGNMGYYADRSLGRGQLYLLTREEEPFCAHQYQVSIWVEGDAGEKTNYGRLTLILQGDSGLNESFPMTKREFTPTGGAVFNRVLVPHPALGVPLRATVHYVAYSGWLSAGAKSIYVHKVLIADSFAKTSSFCKKGIQLLSDESVELPLYPGDCIIPEDAVILNETAGAHVVKENTTREENNIDLLENELPEESQRPFALIDTYEWTGDTNENAGRAFGMTNTRTAPSGIVEIAEPVLRPRLRKTPRQRADDPEDIEISEPLLRPTRPPKSTTPPPIRKAKNYDISTTPTYEPMAWGERAEKEESGFAVQFLPARLASFISRAERYARDTLLPLVSAYAPRLPIFGSREVPKPTARYIPTEETNISTSVAVPTPTLEMKIETLRTVGPPGEKREVEVPDDPEITTTTTTTTSTTTTPTTTSEKIRPAPTEMLQVVPGPAVSTSTALPPVALRSDGEKIVIVYPSNARDERKIRSHSYPEELQFEALYRHTAAPDDLRVDLPTFTPPTTTTPPSTTSQSKPVDSKYIPVLFPKSQDLQPSPA